MIIAKLHLLVVVVWVVATLHWQVYGRENILERAGRPVFISRRRFIQHQPNLLQKLSEACPDEVCGALAIEAITPLLAVEPECSQQDMADKIIDASKQFDPDVQAAMIAIAKEYRQLEKNTPPDYSSNPPLLLNSVFCQRAPRNPELNGLVQAQDPANDPNLFFDPSLKATVVKGSQPNTLPLPEGLQGIAPTLASTDSGFPAVAADFVEQQPSAERCSGIVRVKVSGPPIAVPSGAVVVVVGKKAPTTDPNPNPGAPTEADFGSCTAPEIEFGPDYDGRLETSFRPVDRSSFNTTSNDEIAVITRTYTFKFSSENRNVCGANQVALNLCTEASALSITAPERTGAQADAFNSVFGRSTAFRNVPVRNSQGDVVTSVATVDVPNFPSTTSAPPSSTSTVSPTAVPIGIGGDGGGDGANNGGDNPGDNGGLGNFGSCAIPKIDFGSGFAGGPETRFRAAFGSTTSTNINVIANALCDAVAGSCGGDATAVATCARAQAAAAAAPNGTGAQADAFNAVFNIITNFDSIRPVDAQGRTVTSAPTPSPINNNGGRPSPTTTGGGVVVLDIGDGRGSSTSSTRTSTSAISTNTAPANLQQFTGRLGNISAPAVTAIGNGQFQVAGNAVINSQREALIRSWYVYRFFRNMIRV
ncbi:hypothetical protein CVT24_012117 [Panaeolus cyanescens]|uniref:Uncharacterized protein n=1 Tax=Panaeolus cyanescens TaxID=181874 RepID=A0A409VHG0_9AGAR|nr:hypothetical protein CVT24_012117 [Panaeolus cyanescens]